MVRKPKIYLGGKMSGLSYTEMNQWRVDLANMFKQFDADVHIENPCDYYNFTLDPKDYTEHEIKRFDLWLIKNCDIVMVNLDYPDSIGTAIELHEAHDNWGKPVIGFGGLDKTVHPWMELSLTKRCKTMQDAVEFVIDFYLTNI